MTCHVARAPRVDQVALLAPSNEPEGCAVELHPNPEELERRRNQASVDMAPRPRFQARNLRLGSSEPLGKLSLSPACVHPGRSDRDANLATDVERDAQN